MPITRVLCLPCQYIYRIRMSSLNAVLYGLHNQRKGKTREVKRISQNIGEMRRTTGISGARVATQNKTNDLFQGNVSCLLWSLNVTGCDILGVISAKLVCTFSSSFSHWSQKCQHLPCGHGTFHSSPCPGLVPDFWDNGLPLQIYQVMPAPNLGLT